MAGQKKRTQLPNLDVRPEIKDLLKKEAERQRRTQQEIRRMLLDFCLLGIEPDFTIPISNGNHPDP